MSSEATLALRDDVVTAHYKSASIALAAVTTGDWRARLRRRGAELMIDEQNMPETKSHSREKERSLEQAPLQGHEPTSALPSPPAADVVSGDDPTGNDQRGGEAQAVSLLVDRRRPRLMIAGVVIELTRTECRVLCCLIQRRGRWVTSQQLIEAVFDTHHRTDSSLIRVHVHALRRKLGIGARHVETDTARQLGYRWIGPECDICGTTLQH